MAVLLWVEWLWFRVGLREWESEGKGRLLRAQKHFVPAPTPLINEDNLVSLWCACPCKVGAVTNKYAVHCYGVCFERL